MSSIVNPPGIIPTPLAVLQSTAAAVLPPFPLWLYKLLAAFPVTGLLGLDHFAIGSNISGIAKLGFTILVYVLVGNVPSVMQIFVNYLTIGTWYAYDVVQAFYKSDIHEKGLDIPFFDFGSFGKGKINTEPMKNMSKGTKGWLYLFVGSVFLGAYYLSTFFLSNKNDLGHVSIRYFSIATFWIGVIIMGLSIIYVLSLKATGFNNVTTATTPVPTTPSGVLNNFYSTAGVANPLTPVTGVTSLLPRLFGGGGSNEMDELKDIMKNLKQDGGAKKQSNEHIYFGLVLFLIPLVGFTIHTLRKSNKK
jgi:hypothetical protein